ncbi:MAG: hypothetical protein LJE89_09700 [Deltaproteobacteria bacterium]|nr:hypothetical protein [Deltaproteobacteria bacterium]
MAQMSQGLGVHLSYPRKLFPMQIEKLKVKYLKIPQVFFNII